MKIVFLSWGEVPRLSSVYGGQFINVAATIAREPAVSNVSAIAGMPLIHSGLVREKWAYKNEITAIENALGKDNFYRRFIFSPPVGIYPTQSQIKFFEIGQMKSMVRLLKQLNPDILHCRSYLSTYLAHKWRDQSGLRYKILFDTRSYMPDEAVKRGRWEAGSSDHEFWRRTEAQLLQESDAVTVVSNPMLERFVGIGADPEKTHLIHLNVEAPDDDEADVGNDQEYPVFCYCGYLDYKSWHHPINIWKIFDQVASLNEKARLLIITKSSHTALKTDLVQKGFGHLIEKVTFTSAESSSECVRLMKKCDVGLLGYFTPENELDFELAKSVFATKTAEYLYSGMPVLVNKVCRGAADFIEDNSAGFAYDEAKPIDNAVLTKLRKQKTDSARLVALAHDKCDVGRNAARLSKIYQSMLSKA